MKKSQAIHEISRKVIIELPSQESLVVPTPEASVIDVETNNEPTKSTVRIEESIIISDREISDIDENVNQEDIVEEEEDETATTPRLAKVDLRHMLKSKHFFQSHATEANDPHASLELLEKDKQHIPIVMKEVIEVKVINEVETRTEKKKSCIIFKDEKRSETKIEASVYEQKGGNILKSTRKESKVTACLATSSHSIKEKKQIQAQEEETKVQERDKDRTKIAEDIKIEYLNEGFELRRRRSRKLASELEAEGVPVQKAVIDQFSKNSELPLHETKSGIINRPTFSGDNLFHGTQKVLKVATPHLIPPAQFIKENLRTDQKGKQQIPGQEAKETTVKKEEEDRIKIKEGIKTEYFNKEYEVRHQESEKLMGENVPTEGTDTDNAPKQEFKGPMTKSGTIINRLIYPEIFLFQRKRKNVTKNAPFKEVDVQTDETSIQPYIEDKTEHCHLHTGRFEDGQRRVDLVLVMTATEDAVVENMKLNFFMGVVKAGIQIECELGKLYKHKHLQFVKLYATDAVLEGYSDVLGAHRHFRRYHEDLIYNRNLFMNKCCSTPYEKEILQSVRSRYVQPLQYSNLMRSYIVYMVLNKQTFGPHRNHCGLQILLDRKIILDAFPLHDGPYFCRMQSDYKIYNLRQALFLNWVGMRNIFKHQPFHLIHEYFGSKIAFYFMFYGFYNMALLFMGIWGSFMSIIYFLKNMEFYNPTLKHYCKYNTRDGKLPEDARMGPALLVSLVACPDCHHQENTVCPFTLMHERCMDFFLLEIFECPYVLFYSTGLSLMGILFVVFWKHNECYWRWMWEEYLPCCDRQLASCNAAMCRFKDKIKGAILNTVFPFISWILILFVMFFTTHYVSVEWLRPLAVTYSKSGGKQSVPIMNRPLDYLMIALLAAIIVLIFYLFERLFHTLSYQTTKNECHRTFAQFERALILKKFFYSILFGTTLIIYFGWLKGAFYMSPQEGWNTTIAILAPWKMYEMNLTKINMYIRNVTFRALTLNCGPTSCLREALVALLVIVFIRYIVIAVVACIWRTVKLHKPQVPDLRALREQEKNKLKKLKKKDKQKKKPIIETPSMPLPIQNPPQTTCEREYQLHRIKEREIIKNFHTLFFQFLLVAYFTLLFPDLPWFVLLRNIFDLRKKAKLYLLYSRRPILYKTAGIGFWNFIMKLICYGMPIAHAMTFLRMEMFKRYTMYKNYVEVGSGNGADFTYTFWVKYLYRFMTNEKEAKNKLYTKMNFNKTGALAYIGDFNGTTLEASQCRYDGFYHEVKETQNLAWGVQWNYVVDNFSETAPMPDHYQLKFIKTMTFLVYMHLFAALAMMAWHYLGSCPGEVGRYIHRERILCRFHNHRLNYFGKRYRFQSKVDTNPLPPAPKEKTSSESTDSSRA